MAEKPTYEDLLELVQSQAELIAIHEHLEPIRQARMEELQSSMEVAHDAMTTMHVELEQLRAQLEEAIRVDAIDPMVPVQVQALMNHVACMNCGDEASGD